jgi:cyanophycinase
MQKKQQTGYILLAGGAEFGGRMAEVDQRAIELAGGKNVPIVIIPTAAAPDNNAKRAGNNGVRWFRALGAENVTLLMVVDRESADSPQLSEQVAAAKLVYLLGGFTHYLAQTLLGTACERAMRRAFAAGAVIAGSSAGAMVLCEYYYNPNENKVYRGLNYVPSSLVLPHHDTFGHKWAARLGKIVPDITLLGIDERTGMIGRIDQWETVGAGRVTRYRGGSRLG